MDNNGLNNHSDVDLDSLFKKAMDDILSVTLDTDEIKKTPDSKKKTETVSAAVSFSEKTPPVKKTAPVRQQGNPPAVRKTVQPQNDGADEDLTDLLPQKKSKIDPAISQKSSEKKSDQSDSEGTWLDGITTWEKRREQNVVDQKNGRRNMTGIQKEERFYKELRPDADDEPQGDVIYKREDTVENDETIPFKVEGKSGSADENQDEPTRHIAGTDNANGPSYDGIRNELKANRKKKVEGFELIQDEDSEEDDYSLSDDEYHNVKDAPAKKQDLACRRIKIRNCLALTSVVEILLLLLWAVTAPSLDILPRNEVEIIYIGLNLLLAVAALIINFRAIFSGIKALLKRSPDMDSAAGIALLLSIIHTAVALVFSDSFAKNDLPLFNVVTVLGVWLGLLGKYYMIRRIETNFRFIANKTPKKVSVTATGSKAFDICRGVSTGENKVVYSKTVTNVKNFIYHSFAEDPCDIAGRNIALYLLPIGIIGGLLTFFFGEHSGDWTWAVTALCGIVALSVPVTSLMAGNFHIFRLCRNLLTNKVCFTGYDAVDDLRRVNTVALDASDIFPDGTITVCGMKATRTGSFKESIMDIAAVMIKQGGPISPIFKKIVQKEMKPLPEVDTLLYEENLGISGWVDDRRILVGNREMMSSHGIWVPEIEFDDENDKGAYKTVYLAARGTFAAAIRLHYSADPVIAKELRTATKKGLKITVCSCDANVTEELISDIFGVSRKSITVMESTARHAFNEATQSGKSRNSSCDGTMTYVGNAGNFIKGIMSVFKIRKIIRLSECLQVFLNFFAFICACALIVFAGAQTLNPLSIFIFYLLSLIIVVGIPSLGGK